MLQHSRLLLQIQRSSSAVRRWRSLALFTIHCCKIHTSTDLVVLTQTAPHICSPGRPIFRSSASRLCAITAHHQSNIVSIFKEVALQIAHAVTCDNVAWKIESMGMRLCILCHYSKLFHNPDIVVCVSVYVYTCMRVCACEHVCVVHASVQCECVYACVT